MSTICNERATFPHEAGMLSRNGQAGWGERASGPQTNGRGAAAWLASRVRDAVLWPVRVNAARRELEMLSRMSEYELKDIGLYSTDLSDVTALPADTSPTEFLAARVEERYRARRG